MHVPVRLVKPSADYRRQYVSFYKEWHSSGEDIVPWVVERDPADFGAMLDFLFSQDSEEKLTEDTWVPHSTYWLIDEREEVVGAVNIRHRLSPRLLNSGGHIGYGIRPSERRKGYATVLLALALDKTRELGLDKVLVVCDKGNTGSERTILKNGGRLESEYTEDDGNIVRRFWIEL
jgi:predicted acetyltransferase